MVSVLRAQGMYLSHRSSMTCFRETGRGQLAEGVEGSDLPPLAIFNNSFSLSYLICQGDIFWGSVPEPYQHFPLSWQNCGDYNKSSWIHYVIYPINPYWTSDDSQAQSRPWRHSREYWTHFCSCGIYIPAGGCSQWTQIQINMHHDWQQPKCPSTGEQNNNFWWIQTMKHWTLFNDRRKELLTLERMQMILNIIMASKSSQIQKRICSMISSV